MNQLHSSKRGARAGYTLAELLMALTLTVLIFGTAVPFFRVQTRGVQSDLGRTDALQTARFAQNTIDRELRNVGIGVTPAVVASGILRNQPKIVQASAFAVTFNTDLVTADTGDVSAVHYDPNVDSLLTRALSLSRRVTLPGSAVAYPDYTYLKKDGTYSGAETVSYWASLDSTSSATDEYVIFRRVNDGPIRVIARGIRIPVGQSLFTYTRVQANSQLTPVPPASLPLYWNSPSGLADSIRSVRVELQGIFKDRNLKNQSVNILRTVTAQTSLMNMGLANKGTCGDLPLSSTTPTAVLMFDVLGNPSHVRITFGASIDEATGEKDIERYAIYRRTSGGTYTDPLASIGKGGGPYVFDDFDLFSETREYGVAAQDCSPANSPLLTTNSVVIP